MSLGDLMEKRAVRRGWLRAAAVVHPDKMSGESAERQLLAERIFNVLKEAWEAFDG
jgi:hypothetical protein